ncbi:toxic anion resistance protein, partial [Tetragenococcus halophilus]
MSDRSNQPTSVDKTLEDLMDDSFTPDLNQLTATQQKEIADLHTQEQAPRLVDKLSEERQQQAKQLADQIDATDQQAVLTYGTKAQTKLSEFSQSMLSQVQTSDIG